MADIYTPQPSYEARRGEIEAYFDRTASKTWERLTSDAPVSGIRATVRAGRDAMRATLLGWLPQDMRGQRLLDAGCGTGALAVEAARRGADVVAVDLSPNLVNVARERMPSGLAGTITWHAGDMLDAGFGHFDHVVAMDSVIHYEAGDKVGALARLAERAEGQVLFTFAPKTPLARGHAYRWQGLPTWRPLAGHRADLREPKLRTPDAQSACLILPLPATPSASPQVSTPARPCKCTSNGAAYMSRRARLSSKHQWTQAWPALSALCRCRDR
jgi:magnesium-protoporphyrin O-methyltransferase